MAGVKPQRHKGERINCPSCFTTAYELLVDIYPYDRIKASQFKGINGYRSPRDGDPCICPKCGVNLIFAGAFN